MKNFKLIALATILISGIYSCTSQNSSKHTVSPGKNEIIVDVRSVDEWNNDGHADCSVNFPLQELDGKLEELKKYDKVTFVCRSGHRAGIAKEKLEVTGYRNADNAGGWQNVRCN